MLTLPTVPWASNLRINVLTLSLYRMKYAWVLVKGVMVIFKYYLLTSRKDISSPCKESVCFVEVLNTVVFQAVMFSWT